MDLHAPFYQGHHDVAVRKPASSLQHVPPPGPWAIDLLAELYQDHGVHRRLAAETLLVGLSLQRFGLAAMVAGEDARPTTVADALFLVEDHVSWSTIV
jgi:hypothetical protein